MVEAMAEVVKSHDRELWQIYEALQGHCSLSDGWPEGDWPLSGEFRPARFEVVVGSVLTQNTNWKNVEQALGGMIEEGLVDAAGILPCPLDRLERAIRPSGFYKQKAHRLREVAGFVVAFPGDFYQEVTREQLLSLNGIGRETADSILLYACERSHFVVDAYTRRILLRYGLLGEEATYEEVQELFQSGLTPDVVLYKRFHALLVEHAKRVCKKLPLCDKCVLHRTCSSAFRFSAGFDR